MLVRRIRTRTLIAGVAIGGLAAGAVPAVAFAAPPSSAELSGVVENILEIENATLLNGDTGSARSSMPDVASPAVDKLAARRAVQEDRDYARQLAGASFVDATTTVRVLSTTGSGSRRTAVMEESTVYDAGPGQADYAYTARHRASFVWSDGWQLADITSLDASSPFNDARLAEVDRIPTDERRAAIAARITPLRASLEHNRSALVAGDETKAANRRVPVAGDDAATPAPGGRAKVAGTSRVGRPAARPLPKPGEVATPLGGEGQPYDYQAMVDFALHYAKANPVTYTRDTNDCTTFVSFALWTGRYEEHGAQDYPSVLWNHDDYDVWYWRCNDCDPRHSYTWGGATNWNIFENNYGGRVTFLEYLDDLLVSDVMQMEIDGYGETDSPDHTMMVTGRGSDGWPLLSYHSTDTENKPLWDIISTNDGPYWAART